jgi:hypothetical protein
MAATDILGKIGEKLGGEFKSLQDSISTNYATKTELGTTNTNVSNNATAISNLDSSKASKVSLGNLINGTDSFTDLRADTATLGSLKVTGETTIVNTQTIEVSDNIIELNLAEGGSETAQTSGIQINRGEDNTDPENVIELDKAIFQWEDESNKWTTKLGSTKADLEVNKIYFGNVFDNVAALPAATDYHGMFAHAHDTGRGYFAHGGAWKELLDTSGGQTITGNLTMGTNANITIGSGSNLIVNATALGDYAGFESAFNTAKAGS